MDLGCNPREVIIISLRLDCYYDCWLCVQFTSIFHSPRSSVDLMLLPHNQSSYQSCLPSSTQWGEDWYKAFLPKHCKMCQPLWLPLTGCSSCLGSMLVSTLVVYKFWKMRMDVCRLCVCRHVIIDYLKHQLMQINSLNSQHLKCCHIFEFSSIEQINTMVTRTIAS